MYFGPVFISLPHLFPLHSPFLLILYTNLDSPTPQVSFASPIFPSAMSAPQPPAAHPSMFVNSHRTPNRFFTPTHLHFSDQTTQQPASEWQSRRARKGRYAPKSANVDWSGASREARLVEGRVRRVESELKPGLRADISFWVAVAFTFGSAVWVVNGE